MKIDLQELKTAIKWIETETKEISVDIQIEDRKVLIKTFDKADQQVVITLYNDSSMLPKITKTEVLK